MERFEGEKITFGLDTCTDFRGERISFEKGVTSFDFYRRDRFLCRISHPDCGRHNVYNA